MNYYHISDINQNRRKFRPRVPKDRLPEEDGKTKRVCFSTSINGCIYAIGFDEIFFMFSKFHDYTYYVHIPLDYSGNIYKPTVKEVPDVRETREKWFLDTVKLKCIGKIKIYQSKNRGVRFRWLEKYN
jgi:hypothetical protein